MKPTITFDVNHRQSHWHRWVLIMFFICSLSNLSAQKLERFVSMQMEAYSLSHLLDIYKSCFQDFMGAEHLVVDSIRMRNYLHEELESTVIADLQPWYYEYCGPEGRHVRISLRAVKEGLISEDMLFDAFIRSANGYDRPSVRKWHKKWKWYIRKINKMGLNLPDFKKEKEYIEGLLSNGQYAISHSDDYRLAYHPHYRIVERKIFEKKLRAILDKR